MLSYLINITCFILFDQYFSEYNYLLMIKKRFMYINKKNCLNCRIIKFPTV